MPSPIFVTKPHLPSIEEIIPVIGEIWSRGVVTNNGPLHVELEERIAAYLGVPYISLFANGTIALLTGIQALDLDGEIITTPFSFPATTSAISWNNISPVFVDVEENGFNIAPGEIEKAITSRTSAILPVNCYGYPCNYSDIEKIAQAHGLKVIYDSSHCFGVQHNGISMLTHGDLSTLSFHATKVYNTIEGGAIVSHCEQMKRKIDHLKNFGIASESEVIGVGINGKMNELCAGIGLIQLKTIDKLILKRKEIWELYDKLLSSCDYLASPKAPGNSRHNYSYYPIIIPDNSRVTRDYVYYKLKEHNIHARRYFWPLLSNLPMYSNMPSSSRSSLPNANKLARTVLCLPIYPDLSRDDQLRIIDVLASV